MPFVKNSFFLEYQILKFNFNLTHNYYLDFNKYIINYFKYYLIIDSNQLLNFIRKLYFINVHIRIVINYY